jgi:hypothetical protein
LRGRPTVEEVLGAYDDFKVARGDWAPRSPSSRPSTRPSSVAERRALVVARRDASPRSLSSFRSSDYERAKYYERAEDYERAEYYCPASP